MAYMIKYGYSCNVLTETVTAASDKSECFTVLTDGLLVSLHVEQVVGSVTVEVYTQTSDGKDKLIDTFPAVTAPTTELINRKQVEINQQARIRVITTGSAQYEVKAKGVYSNLSSVQIEGSADWEAQTIAGTTAPFTIIPTALVDRNGVAVRNGDFVDETNILRVSHSFVALAAGDYYPVLPGEAFQMDIKAANSVVGEFEVAAANVHILQTGG